MSQTNKKLIAIVGPTASGKTGLAVFLAKKFNGEIVSADSRQIYRSLDIGTGKDLKEYGEIKYHLIDIIEPETPFTMFDWLDGARVVIDDIFSRGKLPIIVGGTGLYMQGLVEGFRLSQISNLKSQICNSKLKSCSREELEKMSLVKLQFLAKKLDPAGFEKIDRMNPIRLIRLIERSQSGEQMTKIKPDFDVLQIGIDLPREELYKKIDQRADEWFRDGIMEEVESLLSRGVDPDWLIKLGLEYRIITEYILSTKELKNSRTKEQFFCHSEQSEESQSGKILRSACLSARQAQDDKSLGEMRRAMKYAIHAYARRQLTWFRRFPEIKWVKNKQEAEKFALIFLSSQ